VDSAAIWIEPWSFPARRPIDLFDQLIQRFHMRVTKVKELVLDDSPITMGARCCGRQHQSVPQGTYSNTQSKRRIGGIILRRPLASVARYGCGLAAQLGVLMPAESTDQFDVHEAQVNLWRIVDFG
jgi:hypothetical protein